MFTMAYSVLLVATTLLILADAAKVPANWKTCKRNLPVADYETCINGAVKGALAELFSKGAPNLGIPPTEPLKITALDIGQGSGPVAIDLKLRDIEISNLDSVDILKIHSQDVDNFKFGADVIMRKPVVVKSKYELTGKVLVLPIKGKGAADLQFDNFRATAQLSGVPFKRGEETYMNVTQFDVKFDTDRFHLKFENLFDGNKELGDNMNVFLNENWDSILKELKPAITEAISAGFSPIPVQIFAKVPYRKLIPPS